jgi:hypothetical protein
VRRGAYVCQGRTVWLARCVCAPAQFLLWLLPAGRAHLAPAAYKGRKDEAAGLRAAECVTSQPAWLEDFGMNLHILQPWTPCIEGLGEVATLVATGAGSFQPGRLSLSLLPPTKEYNALLPHPKLYLVIQRSRKPVNSQPRCVFDKHRDLGRIPLSYIRQTRASQDLRHIPIAFWYLLACLLQVSGGSKGCDSEGGGFPAMFTRQTLFAASARSSSRAVMLLGS